MKTTTIILRGEQQERELAWLVAVRVLGATLPVAFSGLSKGGNRSMGYRHDNRYDNHVAKPREGSCYPRLLGARRAIQQEFAQPITGNYLYGCTVL